MSDHLTYPEKLKRVAHVVKMRFTNMTVDETIDFAAQILEELEKP